MHTDTTPTAARPADSSAPGTGATTGSTPSTEALLVGGAVAGPLFTAAAAVQVLARDGFDLARHPLSLLSLGELGWVQMANFSVAGLLVLGGAVGLRRRLGATWGPRLIAVFGAGLVVAGVFVTDPSMGFPAGAPAGRAAEMTWHAILHSVGAMTAFTALPVGCGVLARRFSIEGRRGWALASAGAALAVVATMLWPDMSSISVRMALASTLAFAWLSAVLLHVRRSPSTAHRR